MARDASGLANLSSSDDDEEEDSLKEESTSSSNSSNLACAGTTGSLGGAGLGGVAAAALTACPLVVLAAEAELLSVPGSCQSLSLGSNRLLSRSAFGVQ